jgi:hypothetical protein
MPIGYMGYSLGRFADARSRAAERREQPEVEPLAPGEDPLAALDPETRELVTSTEPAVDPDVADGTTFGDRIGGGLAGAGLGAFAGAMLVNWVPRGQRFTGAPELNVAATLTAAAIGAAIGGVAGFARGHDPVERSTEQQLSPLLAASSGAHVATSPTGPAHPAFAGLYGS